MKNVLCIIIALLITKAANSQCSVNVTGGDFAWCSPCEGSAFANTSGGTAPYTYNWSTGDTTAFITNLCAGTYYISITDSLGCSATDSVTINQIGTPMTASLSATAASCTTCCDVCISVNPSGGCVPYTYTWSPSDPNWPSPCSACPFQNYIGTITDACGCFLSDSITTDTVNVGTGVNNIYQNDDLCIYPNPSNGKLIIKSENDKEAIIGIIITDMIGRTVYERNINDVTFEIENNLSFLSANTYIVKINTISNSYKRFFVVVK